MLARIARLALTASRRVCALAVLAMLTAAIFAVPMTGSLPAGMLDAAAFPAAAGMPPSLRGRKWGLRPCRHPRLRDRRYGGRHIVDKDACT